MLANWVGIIPQIDHGELPFCVPNRQKFKDMVG